MEIFQNRTHAGQLLADALLPYAKQPDVLVLALPRGGVAVAAEIAKKLRAELDLCLVRKLGAPGHEELAMGAIAYDGVNFIQVFNEDVISGYQVSPLQLQSVTEVEQAELLRRNALYRRDKAFPKIKGRTVILVDDGIATGATMRAAVQVIKQAEPKHLLVAVPVAEPSVCQEFTRLADEVVCLLQPSPLYGVGGWYEEFPQLTDEEVINLLHG